MAKKAPQDTSDYVAFLIVDREGFPQGPVLAGLLAAVRDSYGDEPGFRICGRGGVRPCESGYCRLEVGFKAREGLEDDGELSPLFASVGLPSGLSVVTSGISLADRPLG